MNATWLAASARLLRRWASRAISRAHGGEPFARVAGLVGDRTQAEALGEVPGLAIQLGGGRQVLPVLRVAGFEQGGPQLEEVHLADDGLIVTA